MQPSSNALRVLAFATGLAALAGCSEYLDHRDSVALSGGNAVHSNMVAQMIDPWPPASANRNIAYEGNKMASAVERYRTGRVIPPRGTGTSSTYAEQQQQQQQAVNGTPAGSTAPPPAPVK